MKIKSPLASTGHGTGALQPASLHKVLLRDRVARGLKRRAREKARTARIRGMMNRSGARPPKARRFCFDLAGAWVGFMKAKGWWYEQA